MVTLLNPVITQSALVTSIPIVKDPSSANYQIVYSLAVPGLKPSDVVFLQSQWEATCPYKYTVEFTNYVIRTTSPTEACNGVYVIQPLTGSIPNNLHHFISTYASIDTGMDAGDYYYNVVAYAQADHPGASDAMVVEAHGCLTAAVFERP